MMNKNTDWELIHSEPGPQLALFRTRYDLMKNPRNAKSLKAIVLETQDWVNVLALTPEQKILVVRQYAPVITETDPVAVTMSEDGAPTPFSLTLHATDSDLADTLTWSVSTAATNGTASASGTGASKTIGYIPNANYSGADNFIVQVSDGSSADTVTVNVTITPSNDAPAGADKTLTTLEDTAYTFAAADFGFTDTDTGDMLSAVRIESLPSAGSLTLSLAPISAPLVITSANIGNLAFTPAAQANGLAYASFTFSVRDTGGPAYDPVPNTITFDVTAVNDAPSFTKGPDQLIGEDSGAQTITGWATSIITGPTDESTQTPAFTVTNNNNPLFSDQPVIAANGTLTYTPAPNASGSATVTVTLKDNGGTDNGGVDTSAQQTFSITIANANDAPAGTDKTITTPEDAAYTFTAADFGFTDPDPGDTLSAVRIESLPSAGSLTLSLAPISAPQVITSANIGNLAFTPAAQANGAGYATFTFSVQDTGGPAYDPSPNTITIDVTAVNDAPSFVMGGNQSVLEDAGAQTVAAWATSISVGPANESTQTLTFNVTNNNNALFSAQPAIAADGALTYTPAPNANGLATVTVSLKDNGGTATGGVDTFTPASNTFTITVTAVNDAPSFTKGADQGVLITAGAQNVSGWATAISAGAADESGQTLTFNITGNSNPALFTTGPAVDALTGNLTYTPAGIVGSATITLTLGDNGGGLDTSAPQTFTITVNQAPAITSANSATFAVGTAGAFTVTATGSPAPTLSVTGDLPTGVTFTPATGLLAGTPAAGTGGIYPLVFTASNGAGPDATQNFTLTINQAAAITNVNNAAFAVNLAGNFSVTASGFPAPTLSMTGSLPTGITFTPATGIMSGTAAAGTDGVYPLTFTAANGIGTAATQTFTLTVYPASFTISGNAGTAGVTLSYDDSGPKSVVADASGNYSITIPYDWSGTVTPSLADYVFAPANRVYTDVKANQTGQDYVASLIKHESTFTSSGSLDGWVLESYRTSSKGGFFNAKETTFRVGDDPYNSQYKGILSFDTSALPENAVITSVTLRIRQSGAPVGKNPFNVLGNLLVDIRTGTFGKPSLAPSDFEAKATLKKAGIFVKAPTGGWYSASLNAKSLTGINLTGLTQFRVYFSISDDLNRKAGYMQFASGNAAKNKPELIITYIVMP